MEEIGLLSFSEMYQAYIMWNTPFS